MEGFSCHINPTKRLSTDGIMECAMACLESPGCGIYGKVPLNGGTTECILTGEGAPVDVSDVTAVEWFSM